MDEKRFLQTVGRFIGERFKTWIAPLVHRVEKIEELIGGHPVKLSRADEARFAGLEAKLEELETQFAELPSLSTVNRGPWSELKTYRRGEYVSHEGGLWHCNCTTMNRPGKSNHWRLAVKCGGANELARPFLDAQTANGEDAAA